MRSGGRERLVINFHGIGEPSDVPADEVPYWCPRSDWPGFADVLAEVSALPHVDLEVTFDDGNSSDLEVAVPALVERGLSATFAVCAGRIGRDGYLGESDLRGLLAAGMTVGSHGWNHVDLRRVDDAELRQETSASRVRIAEASGGMVDVFALPFGSYDRRVLRALGEYDTVYSSDAVRAPATTRPIPRFSYVQGWRPDDIMDLASRVPTRLPLWRDRARILMKSLR